jgi:hypothetical protein
MITTTGISVLATQNAMGHIGPNIRLCIAAAPFLGSEFLQRLIPETDRIAIYVGAFFGMGVTHIIGPTPIGYATGSLVGGLTGSAIAAARVLVLRPLPQA